MNTVKEFEGPSGELQVCREYCEPTTADRLQSRVAEGYRHEVPGTHRVSTCRNRKRHSFPHDGLLGVDLTISVSIGDNRYRF